MSQCMCVTVWTAQLKAPLQLAMPATGVGRPSNPYPTPNSNHTVWRQALAREIMEHEYDHLAFFVAKLKGMGITINCPDVRPHSLPPLSWLLA